MAEQDDRINITQVEIGEEEKRRVLEVLDSGWLVPRSLCNQPPRVPTTRCMIPR